ncbi:MAG: D-isomer specific 2-hydroxyacid dehydrogenase, NAD-binding protein [Candidatus Angelobacter sp.]|nr:D-isomer specific 2-hydroxyacid dehydrogenase, NAD-binding protein [Candidatus Angelobacter sp.]
MKILIVHYHNFELWHAPAWLCERLQQDFPGHRFIQFHNYDRVPEEIADTDVFIGWSLRPEQFVAAKKLRWIHSPAAAVHQLMYPELIRSNVVITNSTGIHGPVVAEHAIALLLALAKRLPQAMQYQAKHEWSQDQLWHGSPRPREVADSTVLVIGMGGIGREFTRRAKALGMRVLAVRENPAKGLDRSDAVFGPRQIDDVLPEADYVLLCTPVTPATTGIMNAARLSKMKPDAYLINVARGPLIDEAALLDALQQRRIAGAALDVFNQEPLPANSPFWSLDNILITPHIAAVTERLWDRHYRLIVDNMNRFMAGRPLLNEVDKSRGY